MTINCKACHAPTNGTPVVGGLVIPLCPTCMTSISMSDVRSRRIHNDRPENQIPIQSIDQQLLDLSNCCA